MMTIWGDYTVLYEAMFIEHQTYGSPLSFSYYFFFVMDALCEEAEVV